MYTGVKAGSQNFPSRAVSATGQTYENFDFFRRQKSFRRIPPTPFGPTSGLAPHEENPATKLGSSLGGIQRGPSGNTPGRTCSWVELLGALFRNEFDRFGFADHGRISFALEVGGLSSVFLKRLGLRQTEAQFSGSNPKCCSFL